MQRRYVGTIKDLNKIFITDKDCKWRYYERDFNRLANSKVELRIYTEKNRLILDNQETFLDGIKINLLITDELIGTNIIRFLDNSNDVYLDSDISITRKKISLNNQTLCIINNEIEDNDFIYTNKDGYIGEVIHLLLGDNKALIGIFFSFWLNYHSSYNVDVIIEYFIKKFKINLNLETLGVNAQNINEQKFFLL